MGKDKVLRNEPLNWRKIYRNIESFRALNVAPVDVMGCALLFDAKAPLPHQRYQILTSLQLSSQTKDETTATAIKDLASLCKQRGEPGLTPAAIQQMDAGTLNACIGKVGYHNKKTVYLKKTAEILMSEYQGDIPNTVEKLMDLPGIGPKMAYICMSEAWHQNVGIGVDTHVHRISGRLGWAKVSKNPEATRNELEGWLPVDKWGQVNALLVGFGQILCTPLRPKCNQCPCKDECPKIGIKSKSND